MGVQIIPINLGFVKSFLVRGEKTILVDAGLKGSLRTIRKALAAQGIGPGDVSLIVVTHAHGDHIGGLKDLWEWTNAPVAVHALEADFVARGQSAPATLHSRVMKLLSGFMRGQRIGEVSPHVRIEGGLDLKPYGVDGYVTLTPGHTAGSVTVVTAQGDAITGDMIGGGRKPAIPGVYDDLATLKDSIAALPRHGIRRVFTCHGGQYAIEDVLELTNKS